MSRIQTNLMFECKRCKLSKPSSEYHIDKKRKSGLQIYCKVCACSVQKEYYEKNRTKVLNRKKEYRSKDEYKIIRTEYEKKYSQVRKSRGRTFNTKLGMILRDFIRRCLNHKNTKKNSSTFDLLGYDASKLKQRIECQFKVGMSWSNYGSWEIDHKKPISKFKKDANIRTINSLCNLQPLWKQENRKKGNNY